DSSCLFRGESGGRVGIEALGGDTGWLFSIVLGLVRPSNSLTTLLTPSDTSRQEVVLDTEPRTLATPIFEQRHETSNSRVFMHGNRSRTVLEPDNWQVVNDSLLSTRSLVLFLT